MPHLRRKSPEADLRRLYTVNMQVSMILTLLVLIVLFRINLNLDQELDFEEQEQEVIEIEDVIQTTQETTPPPPPRPRTPEPVPDDEILEDEFFDFDVDSDPTADLPPPPPPPDDGEDSEEYEIFEVVEDEPYPIGGIDAIYNNLEYPEIARRAGIEGVVVIQFVVDQNGNLSEFSVIRDIGGGAAEAAINAIRETEWAPGRQRGRAVPVRFQIPIRFVLQNR